MRLIFLWLLATALYSAEAQNLTGVWRGKRTQAEGGCFQEYSLELHITSSGDGIRGIAYNYYDSRQFTKINFTARYNAGTKRIVIMENALLQYNIPSACIPCIKTYDLNWTKNTKEEALTGDWKGREMNNGNACPPGKIYLTRQQTAVFPVTIDQDDSLASAQRQMRVQQREETIVQQLELADPEVKIELYDNAEIDDDTVSVFLNNTLLLYKKRLTDKPLTLRLQAFPGTEYKLMMYAENLGRIPPNTSLMVITAGARKYEVRLSSTEQKNAAVMFRLKDH